MNLYPDLFSEGGEGRFPALLIDIFVALLY